ncbi:helix-turn-helix domain-containing protein [Saccharomonospora xinjiangensis]|uniref:helix-turn-helix domain-containing protein n=1 Tax=Saccharomonospora xinjiangensis TaxID=75294 RepID=UPI0035101575
MDELDELLGFDESNAQQVLARDLTDADYEWVRKLVELRKRRKLSQKELGDIMGRSQSVVSDIESMSSDPRLSTLRRYALAVGAIIKHEVVDSELGSAVMLPRTVHQTDESRVSALPQATGGTARGWTPVRSSSAVAERRVRVKKVSVETGA